MGNERELYFEESVLDELSEQREFNSMEQPLSSAPFLLVGVGVFCIVVVAGFRIFSLGILDGDFYTNRAEANVGQTTVVRAERGVIIDRFGVPLTKNTPSFRANLLIAEFFKDPQARDVLSRAEEILGLSSSDVRVLLANLDFESQGVLTLARDLTLEQVIQLKGLQSSVIEVQNDFRREYPRGEFFSHIVGYIGAASKEDLREREGLLLNDVVGKSGLEAIYDPLLRGVNGEVVRYRNAKGETIDQRLMRNPLLGAELHTTIDADLQSFFSERLSEAVRTLGGRGGVGIAIDPRSGAILSLISFPSFDNNHITNEILQDPRRPLFNRATAGVYTPGSTIKPLHALAALAEHIVTPSKTIFSPGYLEVPNPFVPDKPSRFLDWKAHGLVDFTSAIARSSNVYFYTIGGGNGDFDGLGIERLKDYWERFGLGEKTGIDLPSEARGLLPDPAFKERVKNDLWRLGDTYNVSIGQGDLLVTPLQLINYIATFANGGKLYEPFLVGSAVSPDGSTPYVMTPRVIKDYSAVFPREFALVREGMRDTVRKDYGTARSLSFLPFSVAAKTGTAQIEDKSKNNAFFVGYGPAGDGEIPEIALLVLLEDSRDGSANAVPVAKDVFQWYYEKRMAK